MSLCNECVQSCMNFKVITCNYSYRGGISLSYDILHLPSIELVYDIIRVEKVSTFFFFVECSYCFVQYRNNFLVFLYYVNKI